MFFIQKTLNNIRFRGLAFVPSSPHLAAVTWCSPKILGVLLRFPRIPIVVRKSFVCVCARTSVCMFVCVWCGGGMCGVRGRCPVTGFVRNVARRP